MKKLISSLVSLTLICAASAQTPVAAPAGTVYTPVSSDTRAWAMSGGNTWTISNTTWSQFKTCMYWGFTDTIAGVINGTNTNPPGGACSGMNDLYYSSSLSNLSTGKLVYTGVTGYTYHNGFGYTGYTASVRLTIDITSTGGSGLPLIRTGGKNLLKVDQNFKVRLLLEATSPSSVWTPAIDLFNNLPTNPSTSICTSIDLARFYRVQTLATASNFGPYCGSTTVRIKATGGGTYYWTAPGGFTAFTDDTTFNAASMGGSFTASVRVTGTLGCQDTANTRVVMGDTNARIVVKGNSITIPKGTTGTSSSNNTDFGSTIVGGSLTNAFTIHNTGTSNLVVSVINFSGANPTMFSYSGISLPATIGPGSSQSFNITFTALAAGVRTATVTISSSDCNNSFYDFALQGNSSSVAVTRIPKPSGVVIAGQSLDTRKWAMDTGTYFTVRNPSWSTIRQCAYWGVNDTLSQLINGYNLTPPGGSCANMSDLYYAPGLSTLSSGILYFTGSTTYRYITTGGFYTSASVPVRLRLKVTDSLGNPIALTRSGSVSLFKIAGNFRVYLFLTALGPTNAFGYSGGSYIGAIDLFNVLHTDPNSSICTSISLDRFYQVVTSATAINYGPVCDNSTLRIKGSGAISYDWTGPSGFTSRAQDTTFSVAGFPYQSRFTLTATGAMGCKDTTSTVATIGSSTAEAALTGNGNNIADGSTSTTASNHTLLGSVAPGGSITRTYTINNSGSTALTLQNIQLGGVNPGQFAVGGIALPAQVNAGNSTTFTITFSPTSIGAKTAVVNIQNNDCDEGVYDFLIEGRVLTCDSTHIPARAPGFYTSSIQQTSPGGWTCYCDSTGKLLLALKLGGSGAVIPDTGVTLKIGSKLAQYHPRNTGFILSDSGFVVWNRTWDVKPQVQPAVPVRVRYFFTQLMVDSIDQELMNNGQVNLPDNDSLYFWKVINTAIPRHASVSVIFRPDIRLIKGGQGVVSDTTWMGGNFGSTLFAEFIVGGFSGGGGGAGSAGLTPLPAEWLRLRAALAGRNVHLTWFHEPDAEISGFEVLRSYNGKDYQKIGTVMATHVPGTGSDYMYSDPMIRTAGVVYYRIRQIRRTGTYGMRSNSVAVAFTEQINGTVAWPNPFNGTLQLSVANPEAAMHTAMLLDMAGRPVAEVTGSGEKMELDTRTIAPGCYLLVIRDAAGAVVSSQQVFRR